MWRKAGLRGFVKGTAPTVLRDVTFGGVFTGTRHTLRQTMGQDQSTFGAFLIDAASAGSATLLSGPMNYAR